MHIVLAILSAIGVIAYVIIRANQVNYAAREFAETAGDIRGTVRRWFWRKKTKVDLARDVDDPRLAATIMMYAVAHSDGDLTERQRNAIMAQMTGQFAMGDKAAQEMFAQARWLTPDGADLSSLLARVSKPVLDGCAGQEKRDLIGMLHGVARVEGDVSDIQRDAIARLQERLGMSG